MVELCIYAVSQAINHCFVTKVGALKIEIMFTPIVELYIMWIAEQNINQFVIKVILLKIDGTILYVGRAKNHTRTKSHASGSLDTTP